MKNFADLPIGWHGECTWGTKQAWCECVVLSSQHAAILPNGYWEILNVTLDKVAFRPLQPDNTWKERGELPPVNTDCRVLLGAAWYDCTVVAWVKDVAGEYTAIYQMADEWAFSKSIHHFRPIQSERDKAIEFAAEIIRKEHMSRAINSIDCPHKASAIALENAGLLRLPEGDV